MFHPSRMLRGALAAFALTTLTTAGCATSEYPDGDTEIAPVDCAMNAHGPCELAPREPVASGESTTLPGAASQDPADAPEDKVPVDEVIIDGGDEAPGEHTPLARTCPKDEAVAVHVASAYEARSDHSFGYHPTGAIDVTVATGNCVALFLSAYEPVDWTLRTEGDSAIAEVFVSGYHPATVMGLPNALAQIRTYESDGHRWLDASPSDPQSAEAERMGELAEDHTGLPLGSLQAEYQTTAFRITAVDDVDDAQVADEERFVAIVEADGGSLWGEPGALVEIGDRSLEVVGELRSHRVRRVIDVPGQSSRLGASDHGIGWLDAGGTFTEVASPDEDFGWVAGLTWDALRERAVVTTLSGAGGIYAYDPYGDRWEIISSMEDVDGLGLAYDAGADELVAITGPDYRNGHPASEVQMIRYDAATGARLDARDLWLDLPGLADGGWFSLSVQAIMHGDRLHLIVQDSFGMIDIDGPRQLILDPETGDVLSDERLEL